MKRIIVFLMCMLMVSNAFAINDWRRGSNDAPLLGTDNPSDIDANSENYAFAPLDKLLTNYIYGCTLTYASAATVTIGIGEVNCSDGTIHRMRKNTSTVTITLPALGASGGSLDTGNAAISTWYHVYAVADANATTFTGICSASASAPTGYTYYRYIGSFYNNVSDNIEPFYWTGKGPQATIIWNNPITITTAASAGVWSGATSCAAAMPSTSILAIFGVSEWSQVGSGGVIIRPNGSTMSEDYANGAVITVSGVGSNGIGGELISATDTSQQINYYTLTASGGAPTYEIAVKGYIINR